MHDPHSHLQADVKFCTDAMNLRTGRIVIDPTPADIGAAAADEPIEPHGVDAVSKVKLALDARNNIVHLFEVIKQAATVAGCPEYFGLDTGVQAA